MYKLFYFPNQTTLCRLIKSNSW